MSVDHMVNPLLLLLLLLLRRCSVLLRPDGYELVNPKRKVMM